MLTNVTLNNGSIDYVGPLTGSLTLTGTGAAVSQLPASSPVFQLFGSTTLGSASNTLAGFSTNGTISKSAPTLTLTGTGAGSQTNVFNIDASTSALANITSVVINAPLNAVVVVNLDASSIDLNNTTVTLTGGVTADDVLFNLPTAVSATLSQDTIAGTILAPTASVTADHLVLTGGGILVDIANFSNDNITGPFFAGCIPPGPAPPAVTGVSPSFGPTTGGTNVRISGTGFSGATKVLFGAVAATSYTVVSSTEVTAVSPAQAAELYNVYVTTPGGTSTEVAADEFTYT